ncbi:MAG: lon, partial [Thermoleophilia bacterium]|nr:lon [Thermoleophilia bacterium]
MAEELLLVGVDETVVFPDMSLSLPIDGVSVGERVLLVPRDDDGTYANVGVIAEVTELARLPRRRHAAVLAAE